jgi:hypothetical protein
MSLPGFLAAQGEQKVALFLLGHAMGRGAGSKPVVGCWLVSMTSHWCAGKTIR